MFQSTLKSILLRLASTRLSVLGFCLLGVGLPIHHTWQWAAPWAILIPILLLVVNLAISLLVDPRFRCRPALFGFHLCLLLVVILAGWGELSHLHARISVIEGQRFDPAELEVTSQGILAPARERLSGIAQGPLSVEYAPGLNRKNTRSELHSAETGWLVVGDDIPFSRDGFRFYTTPNKGFAAVLSWLPDRGVPEAGAIHFPSFPARQIMQSVDWRSPSEEMIQFVLRPPLVDMELPWVLARSSAADVSMVVKTADGQALLHIGQEVVVNGGRLRLDSVALWMGYRVSYNPALPWLLSSALLAVLFMAMHFISGLKHQESKLHVDRNEEAPCR